MEKILKRVGTATTDHGVEFCLEGKQRKWGRWKNTIHLLMRMTHKRLKIIGDEGGGGQLMEPPPKAGDGWA